MEIEDAHLLFRPMRLLLVADSLDVGGAVQRRLGTKPVWLSTAGAGVSWLHVRLDDRPKYYGYAPYRQAT